MTSVALVTHLADPALTASDERVARALAARGCEVQAAPWDDPAIDWTAFAAVVLRSPWDYTWRVASFTAWLDALEAAGVTVLNAVPVVRWNIHKRYLLELERAGIPIVPTEVLLSPSHAEVASAALRRGWPDAVLKNAIGAGARGVRILRTPDYRDEGPAPVGDVLLQPLVPEIAAGEWSLILFGGEFSHAALKVPAKGDIRVQARYGGSTTIESPPQPLIHSAAAALQAAATINRISLEDLLYARVDGVVVDGEFRLMELELIEPGLFLDLPGAEYAAEDFARAMLNRLIPGKR